MHFWVHLLFWALLKVLFFATYFFEDFLKSFFFTFSDSKPLCPKLCDKIIYKMLEVCQFDICHSWGEKLGNSWCISNKVGSVCRPALSKTQNMWKITILIDEIWKKAQPTSPLLLITSWVGLKTHFWENSNPGEITTSEQQPANICVQRGLLGRGYVVNHKICENYNFNWQNMENSSPPNQQEYHSQIWPQTTSAHVIEYF